MTPDSWRSLHKSRFSELPFNCGNTIDPGVIDSVELRNWSVRPTTDDQYRIEGYIGRFDLRNKRILHLGIGSSGLARRFHRHAKEIVGTSVDAQETSVARSLSLPNYTAIKHNKYSAQDGLVTGKFDLIVDNNLTSSCCCFSHLRALFSFLDAKLTTGGQVISDSVGLGWAPEAANQRWRFDFDDLAAVADVVGLKTFRVNRTIIVLARARPPRPRLVPTLPGLGARTVLLGRKLVKMRNRALRLVPRLRSG